MIYFKRTLIALGIVLLSFMVSGFLLVHFYEDAVKNYLVKEINKRLNAEVKVKAIQFSVFDAFPLASLEFHDVLVKDAFADKSKNTGALFQAAHVYLSFNLMALFNKKYTIKKIEINEGALHLKVDAQGNDNYHFWKSTEDTSQTTFKFGLEAFALEQVSFQYSNAYSRQFYHVLCNNSQLSGEFNEERFTMEAHCNLFVERMRADKVEVLEAKPLLLDFKIKVSDYLAKFECEEGTLVLADLSFGIRGTLTTETGFSLPDIYLEAKDMNIGTALSLLPPQTLSRIEKYEAKGTGSFKSHIYGRMNKTTAPGLDVQFTIHKGELVPENKLATLKEIELTGFYTNGARHAESTSSIVVDHFSAVVGKQALKAHFRLEDFINPYLHMNAEGSCNLADLSAFIKADTLEGLTGTMAFKCAFEGRTKEISKESFLDGKIKASGGMELHGASFHFKQDSLRFKNLSGSFTLEENNLLVNHFSGAVSENDFQVDGMLKNFVSYVFLPDQELSAEASFNAGYLNLNDFIRTGKTGKKDTLASPYFSNLDCKLKVEIGHLKFNRFECRNITGTVIIKDKILTAAQIKLGTMDGQVHLNGTINASRKDSIFTACNASVTHLNVNKLFYQMENFGQDVLQEKHLKGFLTSDLDFASVWSKELVVNKDRIAVKGTVKIENGELLDFKPLLALSRFVKINELKRIQFSTLQNEIVILNQKIVFPSMEIKSNALNLSIAGIHDFDNRVDYKLTLLLSDLLGKKVKERHLEFGEEEDDGLGKTRLYITMKGDITDPKFAYDKVAVKQKIRADIKAEKETLKKMFKEEFGWFKDTLKNKKDVLNIPSGKGIQIDTEEDKPIPEKAPTRKNAFTRFKEKLKAEEAE